MASEASNAGLERALVLARNARGAACREAIEHALAAPDVHVFAELMDLPQVQAMRDTPNHGTLVLLEIFARGTYADYLARAETLPALTVPMRRKLQMLTIVTLAGQSRVVPYANLMHDLQIPTVRELEDLIIEAIYRKLLGGKLDQARQQLEVEYTAGRDLNAGDLERMIDTATRWAENIQRTLQALEADMQQADLAKARSLEEAAYINNQIQIVKTKVKQEQEAAEQAASAAATVATATGTGRSGKLNRNVRPSDL